jgi:uncharacterized protein DUF5675
MELRLERKWFTGTSTIGELSVDGTFQCFTLEDVFREGDIFLVKVPGATAIPEGRYGVVVTRSERFKIELPEVLNVPNFKGIRIHSGNTAADTEGCVLVGRTRVVDSVGESRLALAPVLEAIRRGLQDGQVTLEIVNAPVAG